MAVLKQNASDEARRALDAGLADFLNLAGPVAGPSVPGGGPGVPGGIFLHDLHIFTLGLRDIVNGAGIEDAKPAGWRFLTGNPSSGDALSGDVIQPPADAPNAAPMMTGVSKDPLVGAAIQAIHEVETLPEVQDKNYDLQVLRIPGLLIEAFWLKSHEDGGDLIVPVLTRARELQRMKAYPVAEFLNIIRPMTTKFLEFEGY
jgi:hypothetical protein